MAELQWQLPHPNSHIITGNTIQIEVLDFDPDIDEALPTPTDQEVHWPDAILVEIPPQHDQQIKQNILTQPIHHHLGPFKIPQLEDNSEGKQYQDLETYLSHHNNLKQVSTFAETTDQDYFHWMMTNIIKK